MYYRIKQNIHKCRVFFKSIKIHHKKRLKKMLNNDYLSIDNEKNWINNFNKVILSDEKIIEVAEEFMMSKIEVLKNRKVLPTDLILICVEKNDLIKLKRFIEHYRKLGIDKFIILDNNSNDGTVDYLLKQKDVVLMQIKTSYSSSRRVAWINRIIAHYGYNRWYCVVDSDEFLDYNDCENKCIKDVIKYLEKNKIVRSRALLLDMYAKPNYYIGSDIKNFYSECVYFDTNSYYRKKSYRFYSIDGGCRERLFNISPCLTKYPLFYFRKKDLFIGSHFLFPYKDNFKSECELVLKHYKFLPTETEKIKKIVKDKNYYNNSIYYKYYLEGIEKNAKLNFFSKCTCKYKNSSSLDNITVYKKINW